MNEITIRFPPLVSLNDCPLQERPVTSGTTIADYIAIVLDYQPAAAIGMTLLSRPAFIKYNSRIFVFAAL